MKGEDRQSEPAIAGNHENSKLPVKEEAKKDLPKTHLQVHGQNKDLNADMDDFDPEECNQNWNEYRITGKAPTRRGYQASFIDGNYLYVHGGHDIREGTIESMYKINLEPNNNDIEWEQVVQKGIQKPGKIAYHTLTKHGSKAYLFGGSNLGKDNNKMFQFDIETSEWKAIGDLNNERIVQPVTRDEHSANLWNDTIVIFGGNVKGFKSNDLWLYHINENKWEEIKIDSSPCERSNQAAALINDKLYIFGGKDIENNKLSDLWV